MESLWRYLRQRLLTAFPTPYYLHSIPDDQGKGNAMKLSLIRRFLLAAVGLSVVAALSIPQLAWAEATWRSGHPPTFVSAQVDSQRRLTVVFNAPDGMTYGGSLYLDNNPINAIPASESATYGPIMFCNNKSTCLGRWNIETDLKSGPFTFTTESLSSVRFPPGTYYVQVDTHNEDPYASTRQEEFSNIVTIVLPSVPSPNAHRVPLASSIKLPISNGSSLCNAWRDHLTIGNRVIKALNDYNTRMNAALAKMPTLSSAVETVYQKALKQYAAITNAISEDQVRAKSACSDAPSVVAQNGDFVSIPIPTSNGTKTCNTSRSHAAYVNQELMKIVNNLLVTQRSQTTRIKQLEVRFNQLVADLSKSWPVLQKACNQF